jgi:hypothetical protein
LHFSFVTTVIFSEEGTTTHEQGLVSHVTAVSLNFRPWSGLKIWTHRRHFRQKFPLVEVRDDHFTHSLTHSLTVCHSLTHSLTHCIAHSCYIILSLMSATGTRGAGFGLDAELAKKQAAKYDPAREAASLRW